jgi:hypothetical protein
MYAQAMRELAARKIDLDLDAPSDKLLDLPADLSGSGSKTIFSHYHNTLKWWQFISSVEADIDARLEEAKANLEYIEDRCKNAIRRLESDQEYREWKQIVVKLKIQQKQLAPKKASLGRQMAMVSRSVEGLKTDYGATQRGGSLGQGPRGGYRGQLPPGL